MAHQSTDGTMVCGRMMTRRSLLGAAVAAGIVGPFIGAGVAHADAEETDRSTDSQPAEEEYEMPEGIGSEPWW
jgi:hypothetical protein